MHVNSCSALVTGGASGLGLATASALTAAGASVVVADIAKSPGRSAGIRYLQTDVTDEEQVRLAVAAANDAGPLRVLVNCAGIGPPGRVVGRAGPMPLHQFAKVVAVNLIGTFNAIRLAAEAMMATEPVGEERGVVVNTASIAAFDGQIGQAAYAASKGGIVGMTLPLARDLAAARIRVMTIAPGLFHTPMLAGLPEQARVSLGQQVPHPARLGEPTEYAALVMHILENPMLNGEVIRLDGAIRMAPR